jgi:hypothetical protein
VSTAPTTIPDTGRRRSPDSSGNASRLSQTSTPLGVTMLRIRVPAAVTRSAHTAAAAAAALQPPMQARPAARRLGQPLDAGDSSGSGSGSGPGEGGAHTAAAVSPDSGYLLSPSGGGRGGTTQPGMPTAAGGAPPPSVLRTLLDDAPGYHYGDRGPGGTAGRTGSLTDSRGSAAQGGYGLSALLGRGGAGILAGGVGEADENPQSLLEWQWDTDSGDSHLPGEGGVSGGGMSVREAVTGRARRNRDGATAAEGGGEDRAHGSARRSSGTSGPLSESDDRRPDADGGAGARGQLRRRHQAPADAARGAGVEAHPNGATRRHNGDEPTDVQHTPSLG